MKAEINIISDSLHTCAVITGFHMLAEQGELDLKINDKRQDKRVSDSLIEAVVDGRKILFDLSDGYFYNDEKETIRHFNEADFVFKRSYSQAKNIAFDSDVNKKLYPYGFNYLVTFGANPLTQKKLSVNSILKTLKLTDSLVKDFEAPVLKGRKEPKILFLTRLWNPMGDDIRGDKEQAEERDYINKVRTETIRLLKNEFGKRFLGGVYADDFSAKYCPELLVDKGVSLKRIYLNRMKKSDICVNTMGLHGSVGWKTAEYIAAARGIVSEKFLYETTGNFCDKKNYLSFLNPSDCVEKVSLLAESPEVVAEMSKENKRYYERYLRPDAQVKRALEKVFEEVR